MAIIKMSGIGVTELSGKFGGSVGARNQSGNILRSRVKGTNAQTNKQITQRGKFSNISAAWRGLTAAERLAWNAAAASGEWPYQNRLGETRQPSGFQLFSELRNNLKVISGTAITSPPLKVGSYGRTITSMAIDVSDATITLGFGGTVDAFTSVLFATPSLSLGVSRPDVWRLLPGTFDFEDPPTVYTEYVAAFGTPVVGARIYFRLVGIGEATGQRIDGGSNSAIVTA